MKIKKILVSQPKPAGDKSPYYDIARKYDVEMVFRPFIKTEGLTVKEFRHSKVNLADYTGVIMTSRAAVDNFFRLCEEMRVKIPDTMRYFCTTESIALYLQKYIVYRKRKISFGTTGRLNDPALLVALPCGGSLQPGRNRVAQEELPEFQAGEGAHLPRGVRPDGRQGHRGRRPAC